MRTGLLLGPLALGVFLGTGCATQEAELQTPRYSLTYPESWELVSKSDRDGAPTVFKIKPFGDADISEVAMSGPSTSESRLEPSEIRVYAWPSDTAIQDATAEARKRLLNDSELDLSHHAKVADQPPYCNRMPRKYRVFGFDQEPIDYLMRTRWQTIVVGGQSGRTFVGIVARVPYDSPRLCNNYGKLQADLQSFLDVLQPTTSGRGSWDHSWPRSVGRMNGEQVRFDPELDLQAQRPPQPTPAVGGTATSPSRESPVRPVPR